MKLMNKRVALVAVLIAFVAAIFAAGTYVGVQAYSGTVFGRKQGYGYFENEKEKAEGNGYVLSSGVSKSSVSSFISFLKDKNKKEDSQNGTGSAFIVYTMLGKKGSSSRDRDIDGDDWDDLEARLKSLDARGNISWSKTVSLDINSYHQEFEEVDKKGKVTTIHDDAFYSNGSSEKSIVFYDDNGKIIYALAHKCANPMGNNGFDGLPEPNEWDVSVKTSRSGSSIPVVGGVVQWKHTVKNEGPDATDQNVYFRYQDGGVLGGGNGSDHKFSSGAKDNDDEDFTSTSRAIVHSDVGNNMCRATSAAPKAWDSSSRITSSFNCIYIPYNYWLGPSVNDRIGDDVVESNTQITLDLDLSQDIAVNPTKSKTTQWRVSEVVYNPGVAFPGSGTGSGYSNQNVDPCGYFNTASACNNVTRAIDKTTGVARNTGSSVFDYAGNIIVADSRDTNSTNLVNVGDYESGTHLCYAFSIQPSKSTPLANGTDNIDTRWRHSNLICLVVGKKPKVQILGSDLSVRGTIRTSTSDKIIANTPKRFGSWSEYGVLAASTISGTASGSAFADRPSLNQYGLTFPLATANACSYSRLSFTNASTAAIGTACAASTVIGNYSNMSDIPDVESSFPSNENDVIANNATITANDMIPGVGTYIGTGTGNITLNASELDQGKSIIIKTSGTVIITGNQTYNNGVYMNISQLPQLIIIANKIIINSNVTRVDAWLVARGANGIIETCNINGSNAYALTGSDRLTDSECNQRLTVNGPVIANQLWLRRTAGSGPGGASGNPAEVFNLRADAYLWSMARATINGQAQTVYTVELPPRL